MTTHQESLPLISVIMPVHNGEIFVENAIKSVLGQTYNNFEFIIVDDGSIDQTLSILNKMAQSDQRIKLIKNEKSYGIGYSLNRAIKKSQGLYIARMDADDIMAPSRLEEEINFLINNPKVVVVGSYMKEIDENQTIIGQRLVPLNHKEIYHMMYFSMAIQNPTSMINKALIPKNFGWNEPEGIKYGCDDLDLLFKLLQFGEFGNISKFLMFYRIHKSNLSLSNIKKTFREAKQIRIRAIKNYHYHPTFKGKLMMLIQSIFVFLLPSKYLYLTYKLFKNIE